MTVVKMKTTEPKKGDREVAPAPKVSRSVPAAAAALPAPV
jgi:hypothetical protein